MKNLNGLQFSLMTNKTRQDFGLPTVARNDHSIHPYGRSAEHRAAQKRKVSRAA